MAEDVGVRRSLAPAAFMLGAALAGCASSVEPAPAWLTEGATEAAPGYPNLADVPRQHLVNTDATYWRGVNADVMAARQDLLDNPRAQYVPLEEAPAEFLEDAREALAETRDSH